MSAHGDIANYTIPGKIAKGMGGAMDLVSNVKKVVILMSLLDSKGNPKIVPHLTLPATGKHCVDMIITNFGVFEFTQKG